MEKCSVIADQLDETSLEYVTYADLRDQHPEVEMIHETNHSLQEYIRLTDESEPRASLAAFDTLPIEILQQILHHLDLRSLFCFLLVNRKANKFVLSIPEYYRIAIYAPNTLLAFHRVRTGHSITLGTLFEKLHIHQCEACGEFGGYLYLLTCKRLCFLCAMLDLAYLPTCYEEVHESLGVPAHVIQELPQMAIPPHEISSEKGPYDRFTKKSRLRVRASDKLIDTTAAYNAGLSHHGSLDAMIEYSVEQIELKFANSNTERSTIDAKKEAQAARIRGLKLHEWSGSKPWRLLGVQLRVHLWRCRALVRTPVLSASVDDPIKRTLDWGFHCFGCKYLRRWPLHYSRKYTREGFERHLRKDGDGKSVRSHHEWVLRARLRKVEGKK